MHLQINYEPQPVTLEELRALTRQLWDKRRNDPKADHTKDPPAYGGCTDYCNVISYGYYQKNVDYLELNTGYSLKGGASRSTHRFLAVATSDAGVVLVDPTIQQVFPDFKEDFFIGVSKELALLIKSHGGCRHVVDNYPLRENENPPDFQEYYFRPSAGCSQYLEHLNLCARDQALPESQGWVNQWSALGPFAPDFSGGYYTRHHLPAPTVKPPTYSDLLKLPNTTREYSHGNSL